jgi:hypothetical protein
MWMRLNKAQMYNAGFAMCLMNKAAKSFHTDRLFTDCLSAVFHFLQGCFLAQL